MENETIVNEMVRLDAISEILSHYAGTGDNMNGNIMLFLSRSITEAADNIDTEITQVD